MNLSPSLIVNLIVSLLLAGMCFWSTTNTKSEGSQFGWVLLGACGLGYALRIVLMIFNISL